MKELKDTLWKAADKLRGSMDASQYKDVILGLVFLKYVSDAFEERRGQILGELAADGLSEEQSQQFLEDIDEYTRAGVFWIPVRARWGYLAENAKGRPAAMGEPFAPIGQLIDDAMDHIMGSNPSLKATLPRIFNRDNVDQRRLGELLDLFNSARFTGQGASKARDVLGEVYEYFLEKFARAEGKRGGEFFTPPSVVRVLVEVLEPYSGRVYDPACGSGGMFVQAEKFIEQHGGSPQEISVYGQELNERTWRLAKMNLAIHGLTGNLGPRWGDTFARDQHADTQMDYVMSNPPFNIKDWSRSESDPRWRFGVPPVGNANYAWIQHILSKLTPTGSAAVVMANGSMSSTSGGEGEIRAQIVEADLVSCMVALPTQLFRSTGIPVCVWFFAKDKTAGARGSVDRTGQVLFIDARNLGYMVDRAERALSDEDIAKIAGTYHAWRGTPSAVAAGAVYDDELGFSRSVTLAEIKEAGYALTPGRYVGAAEVEDDGEPIEDKIARLTGELFAQFEESARLEAVVREQLGRVQ
ncbi:SAM-dependent DNA methyltransferase [Oerskovia turbata]|uniref:site-specific DNA-methyltransferase (adenine-specific) n=1 Tax=Oerskovia turbata TaxID=1713 RepID=A0A4Q1L189_9CELL|nr:class I SAM-dependent DNA methyltransferase [Oerskovia turbata]RXR26360.1 SAM-dependent DNA methyltransferase [Oerskovia turbata]RXR36535.1 SAM-dependent DNA methyltransferase [Oerskovia turbata]TGJ97548.1 SAM-dependent DNA methyltransferase [Actinotalea fermentans ATCC 43279 = JCM 9966 = DSM 3133]